MRISNSQRVAAALIVFACPLSAQDSKPTMIPTVLAEALVGEFGAMMGGIHFVVGETPQGWPKVVTTPALARVVGGGKFGPMLVAAYEFPLTADAMGSFESQLLKAGFTKAKSTGFPVQDGFKSSASIGPARAYCGGPGAVVVTQMDSTKTTRTIGVTFAPDKETSGACMTSRMPERMGKLPLNLPTMRPPPGISAQPTGYSSSGDGFSTQVRTDTTLSASEIATHYAKELAAGGWQIARAPAIGDGIAVYQVSTRDEKGETWRGALIVMTASSQREVTLRMIRDRER
jgi:hypothetical protein